MPFLIILHKSKTKKKKKTKKKLRTSLVRSKRKLIKGEKLYGLLRLAYRSSESLDTIICININISFFFLSSAVKKLRILLGPKMGSKIIYEISVAKVLRIGGAASIKLTETIGILAECSDSKYFL